MVVAFAKLNKALQDSVTPKYLKSGLKNVLISLSSDVEKCVMLVS
jgi:hypothetical protein